MNDPPAPARGRPPGSPCRAHRHRPWCLRAAERISARVSRGTRTNDAGCSRCACAPDTCARRPKRARVFPLFRRFGGGRKKTVSIERRGVFATRSFLDLQKECQVGNAESPIGELFFFVFSTLAARLKRHTKREQKGKGRGESSRLCQLVIKNAGSDDISRNVERGGRASGHYRDARTEGSGSRNAPHAGSRRSAGSTREKVRISVASLERRARRVATDAFQKMSFSRFARPAFRGDRHPATRPGGGRDEGSETRAPRRGASRATLMHAR